MNAQDRQLEEIEANEAWLAGFKTPAPSAEAVNRAKQAARGQLARLHGPTSARSWKAWHGAVGAAAAIALSVTVGWYTIHRQTTESRTIAETDVPQMWPETTQQETTMLASMDDEITDLEDWSSEASWNSGGADLYHALEDALQDDPTTQPARNGATKTGRSQG